MAVAILLVVALVGGLDELSTQQYPSIRSVGDLLAVYRRGCPIFLGGLFVLAIWYKFSYLRWRSADQSATI